MRFRAYDKIEKLYVPIESIQFDHLGNGDPFTVTTGGKTWAIARFVLEIVENAPENQELLDDKKNKSEID